VNRQASLVALPPTLLDWLGIERPPELAALPDLEASQAAADYRSYFDPAFVENQGMAVLYPALAERIRHAHIAYCPPNKLVVGPDRSLALYDLAADPGETRDLASDRPSALRECLRAYREAERAGRFTPFAAELAAEPPSAEDLETLRSLGYVQ
jgi:arylsulfatase A-like enzyme